MSANDNIHLLMVDDEIKFLEAITNRLKLKSFEITSATNGEEAIAAAGKDRFDVAVIDLQMPGIDGVQVLEILKQNHKFLEVIILTGHATVESAVTCVKLGAFMVLEKPCNIDVLVKAINDAAETRLRRKSKLDAARTNKTQSLPTDQPSIGKLKKLVRWIKPDNKTV